MDLKVSTPSSSCRALRAYDGHLVLLYQDSFSANKPTAPFWEGFDAFFLGGAGFFGLRGSLLLLRWPLAMADSFGYLESDAMSRLACASASSRFEYRQSR